MSIDTCTDCSKMVDTDLDDEFYDFKYATENNSGGHCTRCRDKLFDALTDNNKPHKERP